MERAYRCKAAWRRGSAIPVSRSNSRPARARRGFEAPHFVESLLKSKNERKILSTLDLGLQKLLERLTKAYIERKKSGGIRNAAALLIDHRTMEALAEVGSGDYFDESISGQVNGVTARRSPGSALKPLVYGLAFDEGLIHPHSMLKDAPTTFGGFDPENFDLDFTGPTTAREALIKSRNVPAVAVSALLKSPGLYGLLKKAGVPLAHGPEYYGLGLALGTAEVSMQELVELYAALANGGGHRRLRRALHDPQSTTTALLSPEASFILISLHNAWPQRASRPWARQPSGLQDRHVLRFASLTVGIMALRWR